MEKYRWDEMEFVNEWKTATQIANDLNLKNVTSKETRTIAGIICKRNGNQKKRSGTGRYMKVPGLRSVFG